MQILASAFIAINCCLHLGQTVPWSLDVGWQKWENSSILRHPFRDNRSRARRQPIKIRCPHFKLFWFNSLAIFNWFAWEANSLPQYHDMPLKTIRLVVPRSQGNKGLWKKIRIPVVDQAEKRSLSKIPTWLPHLLKWQHRPVDIFCSISFFRVEESLLSW